MQAAVDVHSIPTVSPAHPLLFNCRQSSSTTLPNLRLQSPTVSACCRRGLVLVAASAAAAAAAAVAEAAATAAGAITQLPGQHTHVCLAVSICYRSRFRCKRPGYKGHRWSR